MLEANHLSTLQLSLIQLKTMVRCHVCRPMRAIFTKGMKTSRAKIGLVVIIGLQVLIIGVVLVCITSREVNEG